MGLSGINGKQAALGVLGSQLLKKKPPVDAMGGNTGWNGRPNGPGQMS